MIQPTTFRHRLKDYSLGAAAIATGVFGLAPQDASAAIVEFSNSGTMSLNSRDFTFTALPDGGHLATANGNSYLILKIDGGQWDNTGAIDNYHVAPRVLGAGMAINPSAPNDYPDTIAAVSGGQILAGFENSFTDKYFGFRDSAGNEGYLKVSWDVATTTFTYSGGAIEDSGADLMTPVGVPPAAVPEPGSLALLVAGAVGLARRRRMN